jgi:hemoglobin
VARFPEALAEGLDETMISKFVHHFYAAAREDPVIGPVFRARVPDDRWQAHLDSIEDF